MSDTTVIERQPGEARTDIEEAVAEAADTPRSPLSVVGLLAPVHLLFVAVLLEFPTEVAGSLGVGTGALGLTSLLFGVAAVVSAMVHARRPADVPGVAQALVAVAALLALAIAPTSGVVRLLALVQGAAAGSLLARHVPWLWYRTEPLARVGAMTAYVGSACMALVVVGQVGRITGEALTWRGSVVVLGVLATALVAVAARAGQVPATHGGIEDGSPSEVLQRAMNAATSRRALSIATLTGLGLVPLTPIAVDLLQWRYGQQGVALTAGVGLVWTAAVVAIVAVGLVARNHPRHPVESLAVLGTPTAAATAIAFLVAGSSGHRLAAALSLGAGLGGLVVLLLLAATVAMAVRGPANGLLPTVMTASLLLAGGPIGLLLLGGLQRRVGTATTVGSVAAIVLVVLLQLRILVREARAGGDNAERPTVGATDEHLLSVQSLDFSYGQLQVLFDVNFTVDEGEMVALLGTNGAGKSTLLKAISGLALPDRGVVSFDGQDITYLGAEQRVVRGVVQIPGGKAIFPPMSVIDNLRVFGNTLGRDKAALEAGIEATFDAFPRLEERKNQPAGVLSGGEQQQLALGKVLLLQPRLLLIDELSLGLAPVIVGELLEMVRRINATGTAVVLVEQSVNIALSLVDHAYFMERGRIRFDGPAAELLERPDLLRSVFLQGAAAAEGTNG